MNTASAHLQSKFVHVLTRATSNQPEGEMQIITIKVQPSSSWIHKKKKKNLNFSSNISAV